MIIYRVYCWEQYEQDRTVAHYTSKRMAEDKIAELRPFIGADLGEDYNPYQYCDGVSIEEIKVITEEK